MESESLGIGSSFVPQLMPMLHVGSVAPGLASGMAGSAKHGRIAWLLTLGVRMSSSMVTLSRTPVASLCPGLGAGCCPAGLLRKEFIQLMGPAPTKPVA